jgi:ankyrin repeat protein
MLRNCIVALLLAASGCSAAVNSETVRDSAQRAIALLQSSQKNWFAQQSCASCHHQLLPALAFRDARAHGIPLNEAVARADASHAFSGYSNLDRAVQYNYFIDTALDDGYRLMAADAAGVRPSLVTAVYARHIASRQCADGHWSTFDVRPPQSYSSFTATAISLRAIQLYHHPSLDGDTAQRIARAREWLLAHPAMVTEERVYQLLGLSWAGANPQELSGLAAGLASAQRDDGGWSSIPGRNSDAYSTGQALAALHDAAGMPASDAHWQNGLRFLIENQRQDGSWHVSSRLMPPVTVSPPYFETGFPYGHDQVISSMASSWAVMALARALPAVAATPPLPPADTEPAGVEPWVETAFFGSAADVRGLLDHHLDPNSATKGGTSMLMLAMPDVEKARLLIEAGANVNARAKTRYSALLVAAQYPDSLPAIQLLLANHADVRLPKGAGKPLFNATGLGLSIMAGNAKAIPLMLAGGDRFDEKFLALGMVQTEPVQYAVLLQDAEMLQALLDAGLSVDYADSDNLSLLDWAVMGNRLEAARILIHRGADVNHADRFGMTPLQHAGSVDFGDADMVSLLRKAGAHGNARTKERKSALDLARAYGHVNLLAALQE